jgi:hypothetical protein
MSRLLMARRIDEYATHLTSDYARTTREGIVEGRDAALAGWRARGPAGPTQPVDLWVRVYGNAAVLTGAIADADTSTPRIRITRRSCGSRGDGGWRRSTGRRFRGADKKKSELVLGVRSPWPISP